MIAPTFEVFPEVEDGSTAAEAVELAALAGVELLDWQRVQVERVLGMSSSGDYSAARTGLAVARQNGKGVILEVVALAKCLMLAERVLWTAHEVRTMQESFTRFRAILEGTEAFAAHVLDVRTANGQERIRFKNGAEVKFSARSKSATRGLGFRTIICDEAQELDYLTLGAMMPTLSGQGSARTQLILTGTPPYSRKGEVFADTRSAAFTGGDARLAWSEWSCERDDDPTDPEVWRRTNPSIGVIVMPSKIEDEWATLQSRPDVFRRERLGEWGRSGDVAMALDEAKWVSSEEWPERDPRFTFERGDVRVLAVDCTFNAEMTTLLEVIPLVDDMIGLRVVESAPGLDWVAGVVAEIREGNPMVKVAFDPIRTGDLSADLRAAGVRDGATVKRVFAATGRDLTLGCEAVVRAVREGRIVFDDPRLEVAGMGATRSTFDDGRGWKFVGVNGADVSPLVAAGLALRVMGDVRPKPEKKRRAIVFR